MFIIDQYSFPWHDAYMDAFLAYEAPKGIIGNYCECNFAAVWDML